METYIFNLDTDLCHFEIKIRKARQLMRGYPELLLSQYKKTLECRLFIGVRVGWDSRIKKSNFFCQKCGSLKMQHFKQTNRCPKSNINNNTAKKKLFMMRMTTAVMAMMMMMMVRMMMTMVVVVAVMISKQIISFRANHFFVSILK